MAKLTNPMLRIAFLLVATAAVSECQVIIRGRGVTCSNPSPLPSRPALSGAYVRLSCNATTVANTTTGPIGDFNIVVNPVPTSPPFFPFTCRVLIDVPANCTLTTILGQVTLLGSLGIYPTPVGQSSVFEARPFARA